MLFIWGFLCAMWASSGDSMGTLGESLLSWEHLHPHVILFVFLPPLLYESASAMDYHIFTRVFGQSVLLAGPGVVLAVGLTGVCIKVVMASYNWSWEMAFLLGSILSATDPVAVVAVLQTLGAPHKLSTMIEGESLLNDGSAFVLFLIFKDLAAGHEAEAGGMVGTFVQLAFGGPLFGLACGFLMYLCVKRVYNDQYVEISTVLVCVFAVFFVAETALHVSGVLAVVAFGVLMARSGKFALSREIEHNNHAVWQIVGWLANTVIFVLAGIIIYDRLFGAATGVGFEAENWGYLLIMYVLLHVVRGLVIALLYPALKNMGYGLNFKEAFIMMYGGLRGAVGLALGLLVAEDSGAMTQRDIDLINFHTAGIVLLTLFINGSTAGDVYRWLKLYPPNKYRAKLSIGALEELRHDVETQIYRLKRSWLHRNTPARWRVVNDLVPNFEKEGKFDDTGHLRLPLVSVSAIFERHLQRQKIGATNTAVAAVGFMSKQSHATSTGSHVRSVAPDLAPVGEGSEEAKDIGDSKKAEVAPASPAKIPAVEATRRGSAAAESPPVKFALPGATQVEEVGEDDADAAGSAFVDVDGDGIPDEFGAAIKKMGPKTPHGLNAMKKAKSVKGEFHTIVMIFNALKANYAHQYEKQFIEDHAMLVLVESADKGIEFARSQSMGLKPKLEDVHRRRTEHIDLEAMAMGGLVAVGDDEPTPFEAATAVIKRAVEPGCFTNMASKLKWKKGREMARFEFVERGVQALQAYLAAHDQVARHMEHVGHKFQNMMRQAAEDAKKALEHMAVADPGLCTVLRTLLPAKVLLQRQMDLVDELHLEAGVLDEVTAQDLEDILDERMNQLYAFYPSQELLDRMSYVSTQDINVDPNFSTKIDLS